MRHVLASALFLLLFLTALPSRAHAAPVPQDAADVATAGRAAPNPAAQRVAPTYPIEPGVYTTRERTVHPASITDTPPYLTIDRADQYGPRGYSSWTFGAGVDAGARSIAGPAPGVYRPIELLLNFFSMSDIHVVDKESPVQAIYGAMLPGQTPPMGFGNTNTSAYSPIMLSTTHVLDAAVQTINALHRERTPFDFGISLGDDANSDQYNELRWFIDVMDGKPITPSSGDHAGASFVDYQMPYQAAGLDRSIPWYQTMGNHDQYWCGTLLFDDYARGAVVGDTVIDMGVVGTPPFPTFDGRGVYMGVIDGRTEFGTIVGTGDSTAMAPPIIAPDPNRHTLSTPGSTSLGWMREFFNTTSKPRGHGFTQANLRNDFTSYSFEPRADLPLKVIVLDDTCKPNPYAAASAYARACLDQTRYEWLVDQLEEGQARGKLMVIAAHIPVGPQWNVPEAPLEPPHNLKNDTVVPLFLSTCGIDPACTTPDGPALPYNVVSDAMLLETLHQYPNLLLWISGHRHINVVTPQKAPADKGPEYGFWEVETPSLRDFPQQFRTFQLVRDDNNTLSIFVTDVDPAVQHDSPAAKSRGYAIGANRIAIGLGGLTDATSRAYNAELIKPLPAPRTVTVKVTGPGSVTSRPYSGVNCGADSTCTATYLPGTELTLVATPGRNAALAAWSPCSGKSTCTITLNDDEALTASFTSGPTLSVSPGYKDFGNVAVGQKAMALFTVKNTTTKGVAPLAIATVSIDGSMPAQFALVAGQDACSGTTVLPGGSCTFQVSFAPTSTFTRLATITLRSNDLAGPETVSLSGVGR